jgi:hypothetical protein
MKLFVQIPCFNEEKTLLSVLKEIPKKIEWIDEIKIQIIDDWSSDETIKVAKKFWVDYVLKHVWNKWLWEAFKTWIENALLNWADIVVNTDWDNQYPWEYIKDLVIPIIEKKADIVMWDRQTSKISHFSIIKKFFQWFWSLMVRLLSWTKVPDSVSWFRAYSREALLKLNVTSSFSYAVDTLIQAWSKKLKIDYILITTNKPTRKSRLFKNIFDHMYRTWKILIRVYAMYNPLKVFFNLWLLFSIIGSIWIWRFIYFYLQNPDHTGKIQSLTISVAMLIVAVQFFALWIIWDLIAKNRRLIEDNLYFTKKQFFDKNK